MYTCLKLSEYYSLKLETVCLQALSLLEVGRTREAKEVLESATRQFPDSPSPYKHMALLLSKQKRYKEVGLHVGQSFSHN